MPVAPLFVEDMDALKLELRLQGLRSSGEGEAILKRTTSAARLFFYQEFGPALVTEIAAEADVDNPTTEAEIRRKAATLLEIEWIRCRLLETMPVVVADASAAATENYNAEGVWRQAQVSERQSILALCQERVLELIALIRGDAALGSPEALNSWDGSNPNRTVRYPAGSAFPWIGPFEGNMSFRWEDEGLYSG